MTEAATLCDGRPSFAHERHAGLLLWWAEGKWWVGKREELGQGRGWMKAKSEAARPDAAGAALEWLVFSKEARTWVVADLACTPAYTVLLQSASPSSAAAAGEGLGAQQVQSIGRVLVLFRPRPPAPPPASAAHAGRARRHR